MIYDESHKKIGFGVVLFNNGFYSYFCQINHLMMKKKLMRWTVEILKTNRQRFRVKMFQDKNMSKRNQSFIFALLVLLMDVCMCVCVCKNMCMVGYVQILIGPYFNPVNP